MNHEPASDSDHAFAKSFLVSDGGQEFEVSIMYASRTAVGVNAAGHAARRLLTTLLEEEPTPPRRVLVDPDGSHTVVEPAPG